MGFLCLRLDGRWTLIAQSDLVLGRQETAEIADWILGGGHLTQMIFPHVGLDGAAGELLACYLHNGAVPVDPGIGYGGNGEAHMRAGAPEAPGKVVGEKQRVVAALAGEQI